VVLSINETGVSLRMQRDRRVGGLTPHDLIHTKFFCHEIWQQRSMHMNVGYLCQLCVGVMLGKCTRYGQIVCFKVLSIYIHTSKVYGHLSELRDSICIRLLQWFMHSAGKGFSLDIFIISTSRREQTGYWKRTGWVGLVNTRVQVRNVQTFDTVLHV
jgi:hypothetical protein